jgi:hypothetical protein
MYESDQNKKTAAPFDAFVATPSDNANAQDKQEMIKIRKKVSDELIAKWKVSYAHAQTLPIVLRSIHPEVLDFLLSVKNVEIYDNIAKRTSLNPLQRDLLPQLVWQCVISKNFNQLELLVKQKIHTQPASQALALQLLNDQILNNIRALSQKPLPKMQAPAQVVQDKKQKMTINQALEKFPRIGEQILSTEFLKLKFFPEPVRPSVKNWITDYHQTTGNALKHDVIERGNYLFHSENGKKLNSADRQKVTIVLKALDENSELTIDPLKQEIVLDVIDETAHVKPQNIPNLDDKELLDFADRGIGKFAPDKTPKFEHLFQKEIPEEKAPEIKHDNFTSLDSESYDSPNLNQLLKTKKTENIKQPAAINSSWKPVEPQMETSNKILSKAGFGTDSFFGSQQSEPIVKEEIIIPEDRIKFVSPQKLPIEQIKPTQFSQDKPKSVEKEITNNPQIINDQTEADKIVDAAIKKTAAHQAPKSKIPYRITPMGSIQADADSDPRIVGNTVDLKG